MKVEIYIPDYEEDVIRKIFELKSKRKLSQEVVDLLKGSKSITKEEVIELIRSYSPTSKDSDIGISIESDLLSSINSVLGAKK